MLGQAWARSPPALCPLAKGGRMGTCALESGGDAGFQGWGAGMSSPALPGAKPCQPVLECLPWPQEISVGMKGKKIFL